jgi:hypothetical protein
MGGAGGSGEVPEVEGRGGVGWGGLVIGGLVVGTYFGTTRALGLCSCCCYRVSDAGCRDIGFKDEV